MIEKHMCLLSKPQSNIFARMQVINMIRYILLILLLSRVYANEFREIFGVLEDLQAGDFLCSNIL